MPSGTRECDLRARKDGPGGSYTISCRTHDTVSLQWFREASEGYRMYACDPGQKRFIVDDSTPGNSTPPVMMDLTGLRDLMRTYHPTVIPDGEMFPWVHRWLGGGRAELITFVKKSASPFDGNGYSFEEWAAIGESSTTYAQYTVRIDGRS